MVNIYKKKKNHYEEQTKTKPPQIKIEQNHKLIVCNIYEASIGVSQFFLVFIIFIKLPLKYGLIGSTTGY